MADEEKDFSQEESASIPKSVIYHRSCSQHHRNNLNCQDPPVLNIRITLFFFLMTASNVVQVFTNKQLFKKESFRYAQVTFATFHSTATSLTLWIASRPCVRIFQAKLAPTLSIVPLSTTICLNIILPNLSLQYSSITFYPSLSYTLRCGSEHYHLQDNHPTAGFFDTYSGLCGRWNGVLTLCLTPENPPKQRRYTGLYFPSAESYAVPFTLSGLRRITRSLK